MADLKIDNTINTKSDPKFFDHLRRLFSTTVIIKHPDFEKVKFFDFEKIEALPDLQTNRLPIYKYDDSGIYGGMGNDLTTGYQINRYEMYSDYALMDSDSILSSALDIFSEESSTVNGDGDILKITSDNEEVKESLENLFYDVLNLDSNLFWWARNLVKYGDFFLKLDITEKIGVSRCIPLSQFSITREESVHTNKIRYRYDGNMGTNAYRQPTYRSANQGYYEDYEIIHFRLLSDSSFMPYGRCLTKDAYVETEFGSKTIEKITTEDKVWTYNKISDKYELSNVLNTICSGEKDILKIKTKNNSLRASGNHPILVYSDGSLIYKKIEEIVVGDLISITNNSFIKNREYHINKELVEKENKNEWENNIILEPVISVISDGVDVTYDIQVESNNSNFIANGIIVHNSMLEPARKVWRQLCLMEDSMMIHRIMRAPQKRIFYIDIGNIQPDAVDGYMNTVIDKLRKVPFMDENGNYNMKFNLMPVRWDTKIPLIGGRTITIKELKEECDDNKLNYVYSIDRENGNKIVAGKVLRCVLTMKDAPICRVTLDDDSHIDFEPHHPVMLRSGEYRNAQDLQIEDSIMPFHSLDKYDNEMVFDPQDQTYKLLSNVLGKQLGVINTDNSIHNYNDITFEHKVKSVVILSETDDVYCMEVKDYHNFAIDSHGGEVRNGIFVKNTMMEDFFMPVRGDKSGNRIENLDGAQDQSIEDIDYLKHRMLAALKIPKAFLGFEELLNSKCISPDTLIPIVNSEFNCIIKSVKELIDDYNNGIYNYTYSINIENNELEICKIEWAGYTRMNTDVVRVGLNNGKYIDCTPDHKFLSEDYNWIEAKDLSVNQSLISLWVNGGKLFDSKVEANYKVVGVELLSDKMDTCDLTISGNHNFATASGVIIHNSTLSQEDVRFSRTIERIQKAIESQLTKIALIHLMSQGFPAEDLVSFDLRLTRSSTMAEMEKVELLNQKTDLSSRMKDSKMFSTNYIYKNIYGLSEDDIQDILIDMLADAKLTWRLSQIETDGSDPLIDSSAAATPPTDELPPEDGADVGGSDTTGTDSADNSGDGEYVPDYDESKEGLSEVPDKVEEKPGEVTAEPPKEKPKGDLSNAVKANKIERPKADGARQFNNGGPMGT